MLLMDYLYFQNLRWMERLGRDGAHESSMGVLILTVGMYTMSAIAAVWWLFDTNIPKAVMSFWPEIHPTARFLRPQHGLGILVTIAASIYVYLAYGSTRRYARISIFSNASKQELQLGPWIVLGFPFSTVALVAAVAFKHVPMTVIILGAHLALYLWLRSRYWGAEK